MVLSDFEDILVWNRRRWVDGVLLRDSRIIILAN